MIHNLSNDDDEKDRLLSEHISGVNPEEQLFRMDHGETGPHWEQHQEKGEDYGYRLLDEIITETSGKFQWYLAIIVAAANFVDAAETMMIGLLLPSLEDEFNVKEGGIVAVPACTNAGMLVGALFFSQISDRFGRKFAITFSMCTCALFGFISSFANSLGLFAFLRFMLGIGYGGNLITATTLLVEFVPSNVRGTFVVLSGVGFGIGAVIIAAISWVIVPALGWRWLIRIASFIAIPVVVALFFIPESPRFYIMTEQYENAVKTMEKVSRINGKELSHRFNANTLEAVQFIDEEDSKMGVRTTIHLLMRKEILKPLAPIALCWLLNAFGIVLFNFIPLHASTTYSNKDDKDRVVYAVALTQSIGLLIGTLAQMIIVNYFTRLLQIRLGFLTEGLLIILLGVYYAEGYGGLLTLAFFTMFVEQFVVGTLYLYTPEAFPTRIRVSAFAVCQSCHRVAPIASPFLVAALDKHGFSVTSFVYGSFFFIGFGLSLLVHRETFNKELVEESDLHEPRSTSLKKI